ncbi:box-containing protein [Moniliophthora roreri MCA 2997]|uniref:Box-containing protein n=2 Tax=Moniliophthora roreri TaxID=221103 RepID=V2XKJ7_MONRO|nr:box-containing protein [Moniliophthora roreri MCA 2997]KAI3607828.1 box-containing protein [Moniliophthora roreri]
MDFFLVPNNPQHTVLVSPNGVAHYQIQTTKDSSGRRISNIQTPEVGTIAEIEWNSWETPTVIRSELLKRTGVRGNSVLLGRGYAASPSVSVHRRAGSIRRSVDVGSELAPSNSTSGRRTAEIGVMYSVSNGAVRQPRRRNSVTVSEGGKAVGILATDFLYKKGQFSSSRYFLGSDGIEYRWKFVKGVGCVLTRSSTNEEIARYAYAQTDEGLYAGERKSRLRIHPFTSTTEAGSRELDIDLIIISFLIMEKKRRDHKGLGSGLMEQDHDEDPQGDGGGDGGSGA